MRAIARPDSLPGAGEVPPGSGTAAASSEAEIRFCMVSSRPAYNLSHPHVRLRGSTTILRFFPIGKGTFTQNSHSSALLLPKFSRWLHAALTLCLETLRITGVTDAIHGVRTQLEVAMQVQVSPSQVRDSGKVRMGSLSPTFPAPRAQTAETADKGKVRMGSLSPAFPAVRVAPAGTTDDGKVRMGSLSPAL